MAKAAHVKFEVSKELAARVYEALTVVRESGKTRKGVNETTKAIEKGIAKLVVIAEDVDPPEIVMHLPLLCKEKQAPYVYVPSKLELGKAIGIGVQTSSIAVVDEGEAKGLIEQITSETVKLSG
ncbi:MAG: 50S ribosomal protein L7ae [Candidatus Aenigmarchaeota archaeon]|nr:50S ribosomal protein L7ae [Candidatus Aenigmarchaeota archaeon]